MAGRPKVVPDADRHLRGLYEHLRANHRPGWNRRRSEVPIGELARGYARQHGLPVRATLRLLDELEQRGAARRVWGRGKRPKWRLTSR